MNMVQIHMYVSGKIILVETIPGMVGGGERRDGGSEFKYDIFHIL
jgi:hypothetical protein